MTFEEYYQYDAVGLAELVRNKQVKPDELLSISIKRYQEVNPKINGIIRETFNLAEKSIANLDYNSPFCGVPFVVKDLGLQIKGDKYTNASRIQKDFVSTETSDTIHKIIKSGLIIMGRSNTSEFGSSPFVENEIYGPARNPWNINHTAGGSSGGSGCSVAAGVVPLGTANDGGGSIRIPASCNGLLGLKPSRMRVSQGPQEGLAWSGAASHELCVSRSVRDTAQYLDIAMGNSIGDPFMLQKPDMPYMKAIETQPRKLKIGYSSEHPFNEQDPENIKAIEHTVQMLRDAGHKVEEVAIPYDSKMVKDSLYTLVIGELSAKIDYVAALQNKKPSREEIEPTNWFLYMLGKSMSANTFCKAKLNWNILSQQMRKFHQEYDLLLTPTLGMKPFLIGALQPKSWEMTALKAMNTIGLSGMLNNSPIIEQTKDKIFKWMAYVGISNLTGQPSMSVPLHWSSENLPVGVMFAAPMCDEATLLQVAKQLEDRQPWLHRNPKI